MIERQVERIRGGHTRSVARALSLVEDYPWEQPSLELLKALYPHTGNAFVVGITGSPGAGKSTLVDQLASHYRGTGQRVGILAVDPTSPFSGGAVLGDRIRMQSLSTDEGVFIRSMATRGQLGGLAPAVHEALIVLDAAGYQTLIVETVGVGQDEVDIVKAADVSLVVLVPGMGDDVQTIKAGIMEIADIFVINKADRDGIHRTEQELDGLLSISSRGDGWEPPVVKTVATSGQGVEELAESIATYKSFLGAGGGEHSRRIRLFRERLVTMLRERLALSIESSLGETRLTETAHRVMKRQIDPYSAVDELLKAAGMEEAK